MNLKIRSLSIIICLVFLTNLSAIEWNNPLGKKVHTLFYQGINCAQIQAAKYTGTHGFTATTGEHVVHPNGIDVIENLYPKPEIDEVIPASKKNILNFNPKTWPKALAKKACELCTYMLWCYYYGVRVSPVLGNNSDQTIGAYSLDIGKINIAQEGDLNNHARKLESFQREYPDSAYIFFGVSRGAATTAQAVVKYAQEGKDLRHLKLVVLEGCFDSVPNIMPLRHPWLLSTEKAVNTLASIASKIISFKKDGPSPIKVIHNFPKDIPVAFITSAKDKEVPAPCTKNVVAALKNAGHKEIYLLELKNSSHPNYMFDDPKEDRPNYQNFLHALYKKYNLPHITAYAEQGKELVEKCLIR